MIDHDKVQEHEAMQQEFVEGVLNSLHRKYDEDDFRQHFFGVADCASLELQGKPAVGLTHSRDFIDMVQKPIETFTEDEDERAYLLARIFEDIISVPLIEVKRKYLHRDFNRSSLHLAEKS